MIPKFPRTEPPYRVFWCWDISYICNYKCSYCIVDTRRQTTYLSPERWKEIWDFIFESYGSTHIRFSGGEPFIYPNFFKLLRFIGEKHTLNVTTNLSFDVEKFAEEIAPVADKSQLVISASFHPEFVRLEGFIDKILYLKSRGVYASASLVSWPLFFKDIINIKKEMDNNGIEFLIIPLSGTHFGRSFPDGYTEEERKFLENLSVLTSNPASKDMVDFKLKHENVKFKRRLCRMGQNFGMIRPNGDIYRCCTFEESACLGNIIKGTFKLLEKPDYCEIETCKCYKAMLVGINEYKWSKQWDWKKHKEGVYYDVVTQKDSCVDLGNSFSSNVDKRKAEIEEHHIKVSNYKEAGKPEEAIKEIETANNKYPDEIWPLCALSEIYIQAKRYEDARALLDKAIKLAPQHSLVNRINGYLYAELMDFEKAIGYFKKAIENTDIDKEKGYAYFYMARAYMRRGDMKESVEILKMAAKFLPEDKIIKEKCRDLEIELSE